MCQIKQLSSQPRMRVLLPDSLGDQQGLRPVLSVIQPPMAEEMELGGRHDLVK